MSKKSKLSGKKKAKTFQSAIIDGKEVKVSAPWFRSPHRKQWSKENNNVSSR
jgi:hypothetical protein